MDVYVKGIRKIWFGDRDKDVVALEATDHHFRSGKFSCLLGPSGCGKSTLVQVIGGLESTTSGEVHITNLGGGQAQAVGRHSVMMWQGLNLFPWRNVVDNVAFGLEMAGVPLRERRDRAKSWIATVGLKNFENKYIWQLSGGMRQRVALARALIMERPILLMDEPFAALDAQTKIVMQEELTKIYERTQKTVIFVTHSIDEAILLGDEVVVMTSRPGRIKEVIPIDLPRPRSQDLINSSEYGRLYDRIFHLIKEEVLNAMRQQEAEIA